MFQTIHEFSVGGLQIQTIGDLIVLYAADSVPQPPRLVFQSRDELAKFANHQMALLSGVSNFAPASLNQWTAVHGWAQGDPFTLAHADGRVEHVRGYVDDFASSGALVFEGHIDPVAGVVSDELRAKRGKVLESLARFRNVHAADRRYAASVNLAVAMDELSPDGEPDLSFMTDEERRQVLETVEYRLSARQGIKAWYSRLGGPGCATLTRRMGRQGMVGGLPHRRLID